MRKIIIIDPVNSVESRILLKNIYNIRNFTAEIINSKIAKTPYKLDPPDIILVNLQNIQNINNIDLTHYNDNFFQYFQHIPTICISDKKISIKEFSQLEKYIDTFITISDFKEEIQTFLTQYLKNHNIEVDVNKIIREKIGFNLLHGNSKSLCSIKHKILQVAPIDVSVLISGETGTGKELCAKLIHYLSPRSPKPFVPVNCGGIPVDLFENELFGHKKGAYTDAKKDVEGLVGSAEGGILFLDEIESLNKYCQAKLLRFLEDKKYKPLGQSRYILSDVRVIAAINVEMEELIVNHEFREDLYYRLNIIQIEIPPLRERVEDIPILCDYFVKRYNDLYNKNAKISDECMTKLLRYDWPGNVRELENAIQEAMVTIKTETIWARDLNLGKLSKSEMTQNENFKSAKQKVVSKFEKSYIENSLRIFKGNVSRAANFAQKDRSSFSRLLKKYNIDASIFRTF